MKLQIAKLTRPRPMRVVERERLFGRLDRLRDHKIIWISAAAGSGKTMLVANWLDARKMPSLWYQADEGDSDIATFFSYLGIAAKHVAPRYRTPLPLLTREYLSVVTTFTRHFFETLFSRVKPPFCFVIDNYQDVPAESRFHEVVRDGLETVPDGVTVIILSRSDPPPVMSRLQMNGSLDVIGTEEMAFTFEESRMLITSQTGENPCDDVIKSLFQKTVGWAAGLILLTRSTTLEGDLAMREDVPVEKLYDYFATEIYERTDDEMRTFLLMTALLPRMTVRAAEEITGKKDSEQILSRLNHANFFTERHSTPAFVSYLYHPLFRGFLQKKARDRFSRDEINEIRKKAASILETDGQTEDAIRLLKEAEDWQGLTDLVIRHATGLMTTGGFRTLETWLDYIPAPMTEQNAWLLYWKASCRITAKPVEARGIFECAYALFVDAADPTGSYLSWVGIVNSFLYERRNYHPLDKWIAEFVELRRKYETFPAVEVEERVTSAIFAALMFRQPEHPDLPAWTKRVQVVMHSTGDLYRKLFIGNGLILYYLWTGRISEAGTLVSMLEPDVKSAQGAPHARLMCLRSFSLYYFYISQPENGLRIVEQGLRLAEETGIHQMDVLFFGVAIYHAMLLGDAVLARTYQERMAAARNPGSFYADIYYRNQTSLVTLLQGDVDRAIAQAEACVRFADEAGVPLLLNAYEAVLASILTETRQDEKPVQLIFGIRKRATMTRSAHMEAWCSCIEAQLALRDGNDALFGEHFHRTIAVSKRTGLRILTLLPSTLARLCARALVLDIEADYVRELIKLNHLVPDEQGMVHDSWPYPLKVYTLGRSELLRDEEPFEFSGKMQQKPLTLLKALIAFGGKGVSEEKITDALWPDADGDVSRQSFDTTLHRLRKMIGNDMAIVLREGQVSLDERYCWVDTWAFERVLSQVEDVWKQKSRRSVRKGHEDADSSVRLTEEAISFYKGHFLPGDTKQLWTISLRERLREKFMQSINKLGCHWMDAGRYDKAVQIFMYSLEIDDLSEEFYQHLMVCYHQLGQQAEAVRVYHRCRKVLQSSFGLRPSSKTEGIYFVIRQGV